MASELTVSPNIELRPIHWDILKLIRVLCYEGLSATRSALVDPDDRNLVRWDTELPAGRFCLPDGVPEPILQSCFLLHPDEVRRRWGGDGFAIDPALQYVIDRQLLHVSYDDRRVCGAFRNYFDRSEILLTVSQEVNENGRFYIWDTPACHSMLRERHGEFLSTLEYRVFKLTEPAHVLLDGTAAPADSAHVAEDEPRLPGSVGQVITSVPADWNALTDRQRNCMRALLELRAFDADSRKTAEGIAVRAEGRGANPSGFKEPLSDLVRRGLVESRTGRAGGNWLTVEGREMLRLADLGEGANAAS